MQKLIESKYPVERQEGPLKQYEPLSRYSRQTQHLHLKRKLRVDEPLFRHDLVTEGPNLMFSTLPFFEHLEEMFLEEVHKNDSKFEVVLMHRSCQLGPDPNQSYSSLMKGHLKSKPKPPASLPESQHDAKQMHIEKDTMYDEFPSVSRNFSVTSDFAEEDEDPEIPVDSKHFKGLFEEAEDEDQNCWDKRKPHFDMEEIKFEFGEKDGKYLEDCFEDLAEMSLMDSMIKAFDDSYLACPQNDILPHSDFDLFRHNREEMNYNGKFFSFFSIAS